MVTLHNTGQQVIGNYGMQELSRNKWVVPHEHLSYSYKNRKKILVNYSIQLVRVR